MGSRDRRVDDYIANAQPFAQPILAELREIVHEACPDVEETIKWGFPHFDYQGIMCSMASFREHAAFGFWKGALITTRAARASAAMQWEASERFAHAATCRRKKF